MDPSRAAAVPVLAALPAEELDELAAALREVEVEADRTVVKGDDYGTAIYFIEQGEADVLNENGDVAETLGAGDTFGEIGLLLTGERTATVVARTPMPAPLAVGSRLRADPRPCARARTLAPSPRPRTGEALSVPG